MTARRNFLVWLLGLLLAAGGLQGAEGDAGAPVLRAADLRFDFARAGTDAPLAAGMEGAGYALEAEARYDRATQRVTVTGTYRMSEAPAEGAVLSYQVYDDKGEVLMWDGARFAWDESGRAADFALELPVLADEPARQAVRVQFNAVVDGQYWYHDRFPEVRFAALELVNLPQRDHYREGWTWIPAVLPAQTRCLIPVSWFIGYRDEERSGFAASMDVIEPSVDERTDSRRVDFAAKAAGRRSVFAWLPLSAQRSGVLEMRPGLVWEGVRWYDAEGWFAYQRVRLVPPLAYVGGAMVLALGLGWAWGWVGAWRWTMARGAARVALLVGWGWLAANLVVTGYWLALVLLAGVAAVHRVAWRRPGAATYGVAWLMLAFLEYYWGRMSGVTRVQASATVFSVAAWALVLLPLVFVRRRWLRRLVGGGVVVGWLVVSTGAVIYYQFFQDFPSVESLLYAGQVGELGDSIASLVEQRHLVPVLVLGLTLMVWWWPVRRAGDQLKTQREKT